MTLTPALGHQFDADLACPCGIEWDAHQRDPAECATPAARPPPRVDPEVHARGLEIARRHEAGESFGAIAEEMGTSRDATRVSAIRALEREGRMT
jgi:hypothetical protein